MNELIKSLEQEQLKNEVPNFGPGDTVKVHVRIVEGKRERVQVFYQNSTLEILLNYTLKLKKVTEKESKCSKVLLLRDKMVV